MDPAFRPTARPVGGSSIQALCKHRKGRFCSEGVGQYPIGIGQYKKFKMFIVVDELEDVHICSVTHCRHAYFVDLCGTSVIVVRVRASCCS